MNSKLEQLLAYLDRDDVSEIVFGIDRPLAVRIAGAFKALSGPATPEQLDALLAGSPLHGILDASLEHPVELVLGKRRVEAQIVRRGDSAVVRLQRAPSPSSSPSPSPSASAAALAPTLEIAVDAGIGRGLLALVRQARQYAASDLHVAADRIPLVRITMELQPLDPSRPPMSASEVEALLAPLLDTSLRERLDRSGYVDFAVDMQGSGRLRANISRTSTGLRGAFRLGAARPPTLDELGLPKELAKVVSHHQGLVIIAGPSGHGKTTTMAALVDIVNSSRPHHIITIEDPVEVEHPRKQAVMTQREVGRHTKSFVSGLKASLREDPDVIVIGELRDRETVEIALTAAETGHLVLTTMSTPSAAKTIDRLIDMFPPDEQTQARASVASALRAIVAQRLLPTAAGRAMIPAIELVTGCLPLAVLIRDDKLFQLPSLMQRGRALGMIRFEESVNELLRVGHIREDVARQHKERR